MRRQHGKPRVRFWSGSRTCKICAQARVYTQTGVCDECRVVSERIARDRYRTTVVEKSVPGRAERVMEYARRAGLHLPLFDPPVDLAGQDGQVVPPAAREGGGG